MLTCTKNQNQTLENAASEYYTTGSTEAKAAVVNSGEALVSYYASLYSPDKIDEDLKQAGYEGLLKALERYDPTRGTMFSTYAAHCIIGEIRHDLRDRGPLKVPEVMKNLQARIFDATEELAQKNCAMPSLKEIAEKVNVAEEGIVEAINASCISYDEIDLSKVKSLRYESFKLPIEDQITIKMALEKIDSLQQKVIKMIFYEGLTQEQAAKKLDINQRKVSRLLSRGLDDLRSYIAW